MKAHSNFPVLQLIWNREIFGVYQSRKAKEFIRYTSLPKNCQAYAYPDLLDLFQFYRPRSFPPSYQTFLQTLRGRTSFCRAIQELLSDLEPKSAAEIQRLQSGQKRND